LLEIQSGNAKNHKSIPGKTKLSDPLKHGGAPYPRL
jgi:hypothetical protein